MAFAVSPVKIWHKYMCTQAHSKALILYLSTSVDTFRVGPFMLSILVMSNPIDVDPTSVDTFSVEPKAWKAFLFFSLQFTIQIILSLSMSISHFLHCVFVCLCTDIMKIESVDVDLL